MEEKLLKIINHYGVMHQLKHFQSEVFELNEAIIEIQSKKWNLEGKMPEIVDPIIKNYTLHIAEEIADVMVMLSQFKEYYHIDGKEILKIMNEKINRQLERIKNE